MVGDRPSPPGRPTRRATGSAAGSRLRRRRPRRDHRGLRGRGRRAAPTSRTRCTFAPATPAGEVELVGVGAVDPQRLGPDQVARRPWRRDIIIVAVGSVVRAHLEGQPRGPDPAPPHAHPRLPRRRARCSGRRSSRTAAPPSAGPGRARRHPPPRRLARSSTSAPPALGSPTTAAWAATCGAVAPSSRSATRTVVRRTRRGVRGTGDMVSGQTRSLPHADRPSGVARSGPASVRRAAGAAIRCAGARPGRRPTCGGGRRRRRARGTARGR